MSSFVRRGTNTVFAIHRLPPGHMCSLHFDSLAIFHGHDVLEIIPESFRFKRVNRNGLFRIDLRDQRPQVINERVSTGVGVNYSTISSFQFVPCRLPFRLLQVWA